MISSIKKTCLVLMLCVVPVCYAQELVVAENTSETASATEAAAKPAPSDPVAMLREVTNQVLHALKANNASIKANNKKLYEVVDNYILPHVDFNEMAQWVAGKTAWSKASPATRQEFVEAFKVLVVRTYATALLSYTNETVDFANQKIDTTKDRIQISSRIVRPHKEDVRVDYRLIKHETEWQVYDIIIEGVSILQGFQAQFSDRIRQEGLQKVIVQIQEHNRKSNS